MQHLKTNANELQASNEYVSDKFLSKRYEVSRATIWRWVREGIAPRPYRFSTQCTRWKLAEILEWENKQEVAQ